MSGGLLRSIDVYCERTDATFWSEPLNAVTNAAFLMAAYFAYRFYANNAPDRQRTSLILIIMMGVIGLGSFAFHTFANRLTGMMDIIPIGITILLFYGFTLRTVFGLRLWQVALAFLYFPAAIGVFNLPIFDGIGASAMYLPALLMLIGFAVIAMLRELHSAHFLIMAFLVFTASLLFRVMDDVICDQFAYGTHYMWHILNAITLYLCVRFYMQARIH